MQTTCMAKLTVRRVLVEVLGVHKWNMLVHSLTKIDTTSVSFQDDMSCFAYVIIGVSLKTIDRVARFTHYN
jgi:hypothetical protein